MHVFDSISFRTHSCLLGAADLVASSLIEVLGSLLIHNCRHQIDASDTDSSHYISRCVEMKGSRVFVVHLE